ncbi:MAG: tRNA (adenosine(37)-N6)-threonylcarbamoyltransferase complex dimerization subunit type 1 TsaB [Clostridia bacterium]|nr:tRNA (adenosine(37)-N6)-threonylcarbamoyltransferase complex dimerization subunit type 1 TsaB [Clostridia bacterium]
MLILAIDTTSQAASIALINEERLIGEYTSNAKMTHLQKLMPMVEELLNKCDLSIDDIQGIAVSEGPGSFTGIRIGVSAARALAQAQDIPVVCVPTLKAMAYNLPYYSGIICPILDARRQQVYGSAYQWENHDCREVIHPSAYFIEELLEKLREYEDIVFLGDGVLPYKEQIVNVLGEKANFAPSYNKYQKASSVGQLGLELFENEEQQAYYEVKPNYQRKSEAERNLEKKRQDEGK